MRRPRTRHAPDGSGMGTDPGFTAGDQQGLLVQFAQRIVYGVEVPEAEDRAALVEAIREEIYAAEFGGCPAPAATHTGPTRAEAEAKIEELYARSGTTYQEDAMALIDWLLPQLPDERAEMPSVEDIAKIIRGNADSIPLDAPMIARKADAILTALRPWLRTPVGWELDVTAEEIDEVWSSTRGGSNDAFRAIIDFCRSRIRPTFGPCKECALLRSRLEQSERMSDKRHEISHRYHQDIKKAHAVLSAALEGE